MVIAEQVAARHKHQHFVFPALQVTSCCFASRIFKQRILMARASYVNATKGLP